MNIRGRNIFIIFSLYFRYRACLGCWQHIPRRNMPSDGVSTQQMLTALASIPENLRGFTWSTISELALVARVPDIALDYVLTSLSKNHKTLHFLKMPLNPYAKIHGSSRRRRRLLPKYWTKMLFPNSTMRWTLWLRMSLNRQINEAQQQLLRGTTPVIPFRHLNPSTLRLQSFRLKTFSQLMEPTLWIATLVVLQQTFLVKRKSLGTTHRTQESGLSEQTRARLRLAMRDELNQMCKMVNSLLLLIWKQNWRASVAVQGNGKRSMRPWVITGRTWRSKKWEVLPKFSTKHSKSVLSR